MSTRSVCTLVYRVPTSLVVQRVATLATKRTLLLTWAGLPPAGSHQLAAGALIQSPRRRGARDRPGMAPEAFAASMAGAISSLPADPMDRKLQPPCARRILERSQLR